ncbi:MAG: FHA domain-containing protein [Planctomycetota bacterium]|jgi:pSer/pThr/pTyr-binding forkhead associated (FHA) protein
MTEHVIPEEQALLIGIDGWVEGEVFPFSRATTCTLGRSRNCTVCLRRIAAYLKRPRDERDNDHAFNSISRRHASLDFDGSHVTITDLSSNGTFCNGRAVTDHATFNLDDGPVTIRLGNRETLRLSLPATT